MLLLAPLHLFGGMYVAFWLTIYPTTVAFTSEFAENRNLIGYICIAFTIGEIARKLRGNFFWKPLSTDGTFSLILEDLLAFKKRLKLIMSLKFLIHL